VEIKLLNHNDTEWVRDIQITHRGQEYEVRIRWSEFEGYEMIDGWLDLPNAIRKKYPNINDFMGELDDATYNEAYNKEEANA